MAERPDGIEPPDALDPGSSYCFAGEGTTEEEAPALLLERLTLTGRRSSSSQTPAEAQLIAISD